MAKPTFRDRVRARLADERGRVDKQAPGAVALVYPSPYAAAMSSLGYQSIYRAIMDAPDLACERAFLDDDAERDLATQTPALTYESLRPISAFSVIGVSVAYEIEIGQLARLLDASGIAALRSDRTAADPLIIAGGPLTFSNPLPLAAIADAIVMGEGEAIAQDVFRTALDSGDRDSTLRALADLEHVYVPAHHGEDLGTLARVDDELLPAWGPIRTPHAVLRDMFLLETERGCSRGCAYCVMRRSTNGGMRIVPKERIMGLIPPDERRVGLVGAAVSDHPKIVEIVGELADRGVEVGLSSLRPDRLNDAFVGALKRAGYKTLTTAMDGPSERMRELLNRKARVRHLERCAELAREHRMERLKLYLMIGLPGETDADIDECVDFITKLSKRAPIALGIAPFCSKRNTPLDGQPFAGIDVVQARLRRLRRGLRGRADVRATSARWAWVEWVLAQGGEAEGRAAVLAAREGARFSDYKSAFAALDTGRTKRKLAIAPL